MIQALSADAVALLRTTPTTGNIAHEEWSAGMRRMNPQEVRVDGDGLRVVMGTFFVTEWGYFVPKHAAGFAPIVGSDPSYEALGYDVYWYEIKG